MTSTLFNFLFFMVGIVCKSSKGFLPESRSWPAAALPNPLIVQR
jgi:hypothetical protein